MTFVRKELTKAEKEKLQVYVGGSEAMVDEETGALFISTGKDAFEAPSKYELHWHGGMAKAKFHSKMTSVDDTFRNGYYREYTYAGLIISENIRDHVAEIIILIEQAMLAMVFASYPETTKSVTVSPPPLTIFYKPLGEMRTKYEIEQFNRFHAEEYGV